MTLGKPWSIRFLPQPIRKYFDKIQEKTGPRGAADDIDRQRNRRRDANNVFTVEPENQLQLINLLSEVTERFVRTKPGFISASLHRSLDGAKVTRYAQWRTAEDYQAMREDPTPLPYLQRALAIARFEPGIYEVVETFLPPAND